MNATKTTDLTSPADSKGTCPQCRHGHLEYCTLPFPGAPHPIYRPAVECSHCGYVREIESTEVVVGATGERSWQS